MTVGVIVQISGASDKWIPAGVPFGNNETQVESYKRRNTASTGSAIIDARERVSTEGLLDQLHDAGFDIKNVFRQVRVDRKRSEKCYHMMRVVLTHSDDALDSLEDIREDYDTVEDDLVDLLNDSYWGHVRVFVNHQQGDDKLITINLGARVPRRESNGKPVTVCPRDDAGKKIGPAEPIQPTSHLVIEGIDQLSLV